MRLGELVTFRRDLLFSGAVQVGWLEHDRSLAERAARHYVFHGPNYHGVSDEDLDDSTHRLVDTASFTQDILERLSGATADEPFALAIAGYGTGKSHLALTLAWLLSYPDSDTSRQILRNLTMADCGIGETVDRMLASTREPFLVVAINGMQDFDLSSEITRQILLALQKHGVDTERLESLRPRFQSAAKFTLSFFEPLRAEFEARFGPGCTVDSIAERLRCQDEDAFRDVSAIFEAKMGAPIHAVGQESLHDFIRVTKDVYCGPGRPFRGLVILFDEFGRYLEFAVQKPHVAGSGALQQLFECVQANAEGVFLLCFIQYELRAYISRVAPELREDLNRYVTRYDAVRKVRLSINLETLIANLFERAEPAAVERQVALARQSGGYLQTSLRRWFPDTQNHALWVDPERFERVLRDGCWPLHPLSTWMLCKLSSVGKSLQQRSALSLLADTYSEIQGVDRADGHVIRPVDLCNQALIEEFLASERYGQQGASAANYESVLERYQQELSAAERAVLKAVLLSSKIGAKVASKEDCLGLLGELTGLDPSAVGSAVRALEGDYGALEWNERLRQYEIAGDAVPRRHFLTWLDSQASAVDAASRAAIFSRHGSEWLERRTYETDFGSDSSITTQDWKYAIHFSHLSELTPQISFALQEWAEARAVDQPKGRLFYCYVGPESDLSAAEALVRRVLREQMASCGLDLKPGAPLAVILLHDADGSFGQKLAEYWVLWDGAGGQDRERYGAFIKDRQSSLLQEIEEQFASLERERRLIFACDTPIPTARVKRMLEALFASVYPERIPFPFDGFTTARGNAAKDCADIMRDLFAGSFSRDKLSTYAPQKKNRAYNVLDGTWGVLNRDGSLRSTPADMAVRHVSDILEGRLKQTDRAGVPQRVNLGDMLRLLCAPPIGCNLASAGLLLALFIGARRGDLSLLRAGQATSIENWLPQALPSHYLDVTILDSTEIVATSGTELSEWRRLLDKWDSEMTFQGRVACERAAKALADRIPVPSELYYRYESRCKDSRDAATRLRQFDEDLDNALEKIERGISRDDFPRLSWGAASLAEMARKLEGEHWTPEERNRLNQPLAQARLQIQQLFPRWLPVQRPRSHTQLDKWVYDMRRLVGANLQTLGLTEECAALEEHVQQVELQNREIQKVDEAIGQIREMERGNRPTDSTPIATLDAWLDSLGNYRVLLTTARQRAGAIHQEILQALGQLAELESAYKGQITRHKERLSALYEIEEVRGLGDLANLRAEAAALLQIFVGRETDLSDLKAIQRELELVERHFRRLQDETLTDAAFQTALSECLHETKDAFPNDDPPLEPEMIYNSIADAIGTQRRQRAEEWVRANVPDLRAITGYSAEQAHACFSKLRQMPCLLSSEQRKQVSDALSACEQRLGELEVDGLFVRFRALPRPAQDVFLQRIRDYIGERLST